MLAEKALDALLIVLQARLGEEDEGSALPAVVAVEDRLLVVDAPAVGFMLPLASASSSRRKECGGSMEATVELSSSTRRNKPAASGEVHSALTEAAPADSPASVMLSGSPPKAAMLSRTHSSALIWSSRP